MLHSVTQLCSCELISNLNTVDLVKMKLVSSPYASTGARKLGLLIPVLISSPLMYLSESHHSSSYIINIISPGSILCLGGSQLVSVFDVAWHLEAFVRMPKMKFISILRILHTSQMAKNFCNVFPLAH